jgi:hypothetical protein
MAMYSVYALARDFPRELRYANSVIRLELARGEALDQWVLRAKKVTPPTFCQITDSRFGRYALETTLRSGFVIQDGTPAAKLLDRLVTEGFATKRTANSRDLR